MRRRSAHEMELALAFKLGTIVRGCEVHRSLRCEMIQAAHVIPKQALRRRGFEPEVVYDTRNGIGACYAAHRRSDAGLERFPVECFRDETWEFADEVGTWRARFFIIGVVRKSRCFCRAVASTVLSM